MKNVNKIYRSRSSKILGGVCGGLSDYLQIDVVFIRALFVIAAIGFGTGIITYIVLWVMVPLERESIFGTRGGIYE